MLYHVGVLGELQDLGIVNPTTPLAGASSAALVIAAIKSGITAEQLEAVCIHIASSCQSNRVLFHEQLDAYLRAWLNIFPTAFRSYCDSVFISVTSVLPTLKHQLVSKFSSNEDLRQAIQASWSLPSTKVCACSTYRNKLTIDGFAFDHIPQVPRVLVSADVCCFPSAHLRNRKQLSGQKKRVPPSICPDAFGAVPTVDWAAISVTAGTAEELHTLYLKGRLDARAWADKEGILAFIRTEQGQQLTELPITSVAPSSCQHNGYNDVGSVFHAPAAFLAPALPSICEDPLGSKRPSIVCVV